MLMQGMAWSKANMEAQSHQGSREESNNWRRKLETALPSPIRNPLVLKSYPPCLLHHLPMLTPSVVSDFWLA